MKYEKGKFTVVPTGYLKGLDVTTQVLFVWLCSFADSDGKCFPSIKKLMEVSGIKSNKTIHDKLSLLVEKGLIEKTSSKRKDGTNNPNVYQLLLPSVMVTPHSVIDTKSHVGELHTNYNSINYTNTNVLGSDNGDVELPVLLDTGNNNTVAEPTKVAKKVISGADINKVLAVWNKYNGAIGYMHKGQRNAVAAMLDKFTVEEAIDYVKLAISVQGEQFAPSITSPYELRSKNIKLMQFLDRRNGQ